MIEILVFIIILIIQISLASYALLASHKIDQKYRYPLGSQVESAVALENYVKIYREVNVRVNADIEIPAYAFEEHIYINRDKMYDFDLFTNFFTIFQLELSRKEHNFARKLNIFQNILFILSFIIFFIGAATLSQDATISSYSFRFAIGLQTFLIFISFLGFSTYNTILKKSLAVASDLLDLDEVEYARADRLKDDLKLHVFEYPLVVFGRLVRFFLPF